MSETPPRVGRRLLVSDVDSTLIEQEVIDLLAVHAGRHQEVAAITEAAMRGEIDFAQSLAERVAALAGVPATALEEVAREVTLTAGARELVDHLHSEGWEVALVSGGFEEIVSVLATDLGITRFRANRLEVVDGHLTGRTVGPVIDRQAKAAALREFAAEVGAHLSDTVAIGDGANDLEMMAIAGFSIAFNAKPNVQAEAQAVVSGDRLDEAIPILNHWFNAS